MEKRLYPRIASVFPVEFKNTINNISETSKGETVNLSETGLCIILNKPLPSLSKGFAQLNPSPKYPSFKANAKIIWSNQMLGKNKFRCGIQFLDIDREKLKILKNILLDHNKKSFIFEKIVYLCDTNAEGNVYFTKYFDWQGMAREEFYRQHFPLEIWKSGLKLITAQASIEYKHEAFLFDEILIAIYIANVKKMSLELIFTYVNKKTGKLLATGKETIAFGDSKGKLIPIPKEIKENTKHFLLEEINNYKK